MSYIHYTCFQYRPRVFAGKAPSPSFYFENDLPSYLLKGLEEHFFGGKVAFVEALLYHVNIIQNLINYAHDLWPLEIPEKGSRTS